MEQGKNIKMINAFFLENIQMEIVGMEQELDQNLMKKKKMMKKMKKRKKKKRKVMKIHKIIKKYDI